MSGVYVCAYVCVWDAPSDCWFFSPFILATNSKFRVRAQASEMYLNEGNERVYKNEKCEVCDYLCV